MRESRAPATRRACRADWLGAAPGTATDWCLLGFVNAMRQSELAGQFGDGGEQSIRIRLRDSRSDQDG
ncbi:MAG: hypothetical protein L0H41_03090 [Microlunatus sp.]|nr:hypothetical protein [Microlunatus sp.]MDN5770443.1 hypothetical protein [Microlunatus sp.]